MSRLQMEDQRRRTGHLQMARNTFARGVETMRRHRLALITATIAVFASGCECSDTVSNPTTPDTPKGTIHIERVPEAETVLAELDRVSWVFEHRGGELTTDFTIYHRPEGKDQTQTVVFRALGDEVVRALRSQPDNEGDRDEESGYIIVVVPDIPDVGDVVHRFSLNRLGFTKKVPAKDVIPNTVFSHSGSFEKGFGRPPDTVQLRPGETHVLVDDGVRLVSSGAEVAPDEREMIRYVLTVTALKDGQISERDESVRGK
ncbi:hypothetical protein N9089_05180 [Crocinitomicaceae bacterium]|nr:hypothetical protein [Crocinitomicaceae bacterium]